LAQAFVELYRHYLGASAPTPEAIRENLKRDILGPGSTTRVVVAMEAEHVAGLATFAILYPAPGALGQLFMKDLYVRNAWRGRGVGEQIMGFLARYAVSNNCVRFDWTTETGNAGAINFYKRLGATHVQEKVYFRLAGEDLVAFASSSQDRSAREQGDA
jgi:GNAT superfamily N-acetyltransferase